MNRFILGMIAVATIAAGAPVPAAAVNALPVKTPASPSPFTWGGAYAGGSVGMIWANPLKDSGGVLGDNFQYRQFVCIKIGHRLSC